MSSVIRPGDIVAKDPQAQRVYAFDWSELLGATASIADKSVDVAVFDGVDVTPMTVDNVTVVTGGLVRFRAVNGTLDVTYRVTCTITTDEAVVQIEPRSFFVKIVRQ